tara:strand:- start:810 stop:1034 length:225 start_codon:yes stop_codon:yes gene_type:complete
VVAKGQKRRGIVLTGRRCRKILPRRAERSLGATSANERDEAPASAAAMAATCLGVVSQKEFVRTSCDPVSMKEA